MKVTKFEDLVEELKSKLKKDEDIVVVEEEKESSAGKIVGTILAIIGGLAVICAAGYFLYKYLKPDYLEDYEDDFEDEDEEDVEVED